MKSFDALQPQSLRRDLPPFRPGDTVRIHVKIQEGEKERIQIFEGLVIRRRGGGAGATFTVDKISLDLRYWDTDVKNTVAGLTTNLCNNGTGFLQCDQTFVATVKVVLP